VDLCRMHHRFICAREYRVALDVSLLFAADLEFVLLPAQLAYESYKARLIIRSRDIAFAYTNVMANDYYSVRDYDYFCFWCHVSESEKKKDIITGFVFFTFKGSL
jgi:hypothetical protein